MKTATLILCILLITLTPACGGDGSNVAAQATATPDPRTTGIAITCHPKPTRF
jgi:hypothetical protein